MASRKRINPVNKAGGQAIYRRKHASTKLHATHNTLRHKTVYDPRRESQYHGRRHTTVGWSIWLDPPQRGQVVLHHA